MKRGVYGGSFNPIHKGHIKIAEQILKAQGLDSVIFIPAACSPFKKDSRDYAPDADRMNMCRLALENNPNFEVSDIEISRGGVSYTVDTLKFLKEMDPEDELYLIMGADMFISLYNWKSYREIFRLAHICTVPRDENDISVLEDYAKRYRLEGADIHIQNIELLPYSSTEIRDAVRQGIEITDMTEQSVAEYIAEKRLYL